MYVLAFGLPAIIVIDFKPQIEGVVLVVVPLSYMYNAQTAMNTDHAADCCSVVLIFYIRKSKYNMAI